MAYLGRAARQAESGQDLRTVGGRLVRMSSESDDPDPESGIDADRRVARGGAAARGRYGRNAMVQGAAAELFKVWAVTVRARAVAASVRRIVLCLHDELLVHAPVEASNAARESLDDGLLEAAHRWEPAGDVRFVAETSVITRWSDAK